jgi:2-polyprenyl-6-methoxyphenol hydroxylase-like FAD-dependent oxidoreductase
MKVASVGGGPAGLFLAILLKCSDPAHEVVVYERNAPDATFGFGVVFSANTMRFIGEADPQTLARIVEESVQWTDIEVRFRGERIRAAGNDFAAIARKRLLLVLQERARELGVDLRFETEARVDELNGFDVVLGADGVNSATRDARAATVAPSVELGRAKYIWFATPQPFDALTMAFEDNQHGHFGLHAYPFEPGTSTFIVETDEGSWRNAGLDATADRAFAPGESDELALKYCERLFADHLGGHGLLTNNSKWLQFPTVTCGRWTDESVVLMGDAVHTAHFSVGSGTKMAMEDSIALAQALTEADAHDPVPALAAYERARRPRVEHIQRVAAPSQVWWERFRHQATFGPQRFAFHFLTRTFDLTTDKIRGRDPVLVEAVEREAALGRDAAAPLDAGLTPSGDGGSTPARSVPDRDGALGQALLGGDDALAEAAATAAAATVRAAVSERISGETIVVHVRTPTDVPDIRAPAAAVAGLQTLLDAGAEAFALSAATEDPASRAWTAQHLLADLVRNELGLPVLLITPSRADGTTQVLAGRADAWREPASLDT